MGGNGRRIDEETMVKSMHEKGNKHIFYLLKLLLCAKINSGAVEL